jgi:Ca-activated chloride channel family protein
MEFNRRHLKGQEGGRHRRTRSRWVLLATAVALTSATGVVAAASTRDESHSAGCSQRRTLAVVAAVELVPAIKKLSTSVPCVRVRVVPGDSSTVARQMAHGAAASDVWIPDSSRWTTGLRGESVAWSPVVLSIPAAKPDGKSRPDTIEGLAQLADASHTLNFTAEEPTRSATTQAILNELAHALRATPTLRGHLAMLVRGLRSAASDGRSRQPETMGASTEQAVWAQNPGTGVAKLRAVYPPAPGLAMDYPFVVTTPEPTARRDAQALLRALLSPRGVAVVHGLGFRSPGGQVNPLLQQAAGVDPAKNSTAPALTRRRAESALHMWATLNRPSRVLALVDVSGSMGQPVPGAHPVTRIELARTALHRAVQLFPRGTVAGLWRFSSDLTPSTNYAQMMPLTPLTVSSRRMLDASINELSAIPGGGTGLYDSVLAAVRYVRAGYDPERVNSVVVLSDGRNEYASAHGITKASLLSALAAEADGEPAVPVISIAYGPSSDIPALRAISNATGGTVYTARDPRDLPMIFRDAIGQRVCGSEC